MTAPEPAVNVTATTYTVSVLPDDNIDHDTYAITVEARGNGLWAVLRHRWCLGSDGEWEFEPIPSERTDEWLASHRFPLDEAVELARRAAPKVRVNGMTAAQVAVAGAR